MQRQVGFELEQMLHRIEEIEKNSNRTESLRKALRGQVDMAGVCEVLRQAGAVFYKDHRECPEVVKTGLLEPERKRNELMSLICPGGVWKWRAEAED